MTTCSTGLEDKAGFRKLARENVRALSEAQRKTFSASACAAVALMKEFAAADTVLVYKPIREECSPGAITALARAAGKRTAFPLCLPDNRLALYIASTDADFVTGAYGIQEPDPRRCVAVEAAEIDFAVIPGMAFDRSCKRLGRGAGYYDRLLENFHGVKVGFAYDCQIFDSVPACDHDVKMDFVATNNGIIVNKQQ